MRHTLRETWSGLRRNLSMTIAVLVTMWVSLTLFGAGLMATQQVDLIKDNWVGKIEISIFLCAPDMGGQNCDPGQDATDAQRALIRTALEDNPLVDRVYYESKAEAFVEFRKAFKDSALLETLTESQMQDSFRVKLVDPKNYQGVIAEARTLPGVQDVQDLHTILDPVFNWLNALKWATLGLSGLLLLAAALQIGNSIRMAAFARRRELGIMRLVGASNSYIMLPFLLESLAVGVLGAALACGTLASGMYFIIIKNAQVSIKSLAWIDWSHAGVAMAGVALVGIALSIIPTLLATRKYLRV